MEAAAPAHEAPVYETGAKKWFIAVTVILCSLLELIDTSIVNVALTDISGNIGATINEVTWVVASYAIANVIVVPLSGFLSNQFGRRNYFAASVVLFTVASAFCGQATDIWELVAFRFIQGLGGGALLATSQAILTETFPPQQRGMATAMFGMGVIMGPTIGPTLGGYIVDNLSWPWIFYVNVPIGIIATIMTLALIRNAKYEGKKVSFWQVDWLGLMLLIVGVGSLQLVLEQGEKDDWFNAPYIVAFTAASLLGVGFFIWRQLTAKRPIVDLRVMRVPSLSIGMVMLFVLGFALYAANFTVPVFCQAILGFTAAQTGFLLLPGALMSGFMMPIAGQMVQRGVNAKYMVMFGFSMVIIFSIWLSQKMVPSTGEGDFFWPLIVRGVGMAFLFIPLTNLSLSGLKGAQIGQGAGLTNMMRQLGGSFGVAIISTYVERRQYLHRNELLNHLSSYDPEVQSRLAAFTQGFLARGGSIVQAQQQAYGAFEGILRKQTAILSYIDSFTFLAIFCLVCLPLVLIIRMPKGGGPKLSAGDVH